MTAPDDLEVLGLKGVPEKHLQVLSKFVALQGTIFEGEHEIRGEKGSAGIAPDSFVAGAHRLHGLVRGIYVPQGDPYALSVLLTEKETNYGKELTYLSPDRWRVEYKPPKILRARPDIRALERCYTDGVPIGVLRNMKKGSNMVLGLGEIIRHDGPEFSIVPFKPAATTQKRIESLVERHVQDRTSRDDYSAPDLETTAIARVGQRWFRDSLLRAYGGRCAFCGFGIPDFLIAAHIVPYADDRKNRLNPKNGLLLCRLCDVAFEEGYLTLTEMMEIAVLPELRKFEGGSRSVSSWLSNLRARIKPSDPSMSPLPELVKEHNRLLTEGMP